ncbi:hypothetical protein PP713_06190 [Mycobacterium sp. CSUR Q5927]|nr:hypothetical protein [Mycobacterium sp. CSUR Q5927]
MTPPPWPAPPAAQPHRRSSVLPAVLAALVAVAALIVAIIALTRAAESPSYSTAQRTDAKKELCDRYKPAMDAVHIETNGTDAALARIAVVNGALILEGAVSNPALDTDYRDAAQAVVQAYENLVVESSSGSAGNPRFDAALSAVTTKERALKELCGD